MEKSKAHLESMVKRALSAGIKAQYVLMDSRDYDALVAHTSIVFMRYMFLAYQQRTSTDHRTYGELFYACCDEIKDISFMEALYRLLALALANIRKMGTFCEKTVQSFFDAIIDAALDCVNMSKNKIKPVKF